MHLRLRISFAVALLLAVLLSTWMAFAAPPVYQIAPQPSWAERIDVDLATTSAGSGASGLANGRERLLLQRHLRSSGSNLDTFVHNATRVVNESGLEAASVISWDVDPTSERLELHYVVVHRGGERLDRLRPEVIRVSGSERDLGGRVFQANKNVALVLEDIRVGDVLEYAYTVRSSDPTLGGRAAMAVDLGADGEALKRLHVRISVARGSPRGWRLHTPDGDYAPPADIQQTASTEEFIWDRRDITPVEEEDDVPSWYSSTPWIEFSGFETWGEVVRWGLKLYGDSGEPTPAIREWVAKARKEAESDNAFVLQATRFVQEQVRYVGIEVGMGRRRPSPAGEVFRRRYGDCKDKSVLLTAMLRAGGVKASPALVSTSHGPVVVTMLPSPTVFDHVIVAVGPPNDPTYWIDPTGKSEGGGLGRYRYSPHGYALTLAEPIDGLEQLPAEPWETPPTVSVLDTYRVQLPGSNVPVDLDSERTYRRDMADYFRKRFQTQSTTELEKLFLSVFTQRFPHVEQRAPLEHRDDREHNELVVVGHYRVPEFWTWNEAAKHQEVQVTAELIDDFLKYPASKNRRTPLSLEHTFSVHQEAILLIAEGLELVPTSGEEDSEGFLFSYNFLRGADNVHLIWHYASKKAFVPASSFAAHTKSVDNARQWLTRNWSYPVQPQDGVHWAALLGMMAAAAAALFGGWRAFLWSPPRPLELPDDAVPAGVTVGIVLLGLRCVFVPFRMLWALLEQRWVLSTAEWAGALEAWADHRIAGVAVQMADGAFAVWMVVHSLVVAVTFFQKRRSFRAHFVWFAVIGTFWPVVETILVHNVIAPDAQRTENSLGLVLALLVSLAFVYYVGQAKAVRARFIL